MPCAKPSKNKNQWRIFATMETYLVTALNLCIRCPSHDRLHSRSSSRGGQVRLGDVCERQEYERDYAPRDETRVTVSWIRGEGVCDGPWESELPVGD